MPKTLEFSEQLKNLKLCTKSSLELLIRTSTNESDLAINVLVAKGFKSGPVLVVLAGIHGDEYEGILAIQDLFQYLDPNSLKGAVIMIPICNPIAFEAHTRSTPTDGKNLARVFPGSMHGTITEKIAFALSKVIQQGDFLIDLHSAGTTMTSPTLVGYYRQAGHTGDKAAQAAKVFGAAVIWEHPKIEAGRTLSLAAEYGIPAIYTEAKGGLRVDKNDLNIYKEGVLNVMGYLDILERLAVNTETLYLRGDGNTDTMLSFQSSGLFRPTVEVLQEVCIGDLIGIVKDVDGSILEELKSPKQGRVVFLRAVPAVKKDDLAVLITNEIKAISQDE